MPPIGGLPTRPQRSPLEVTVDWVRSNPRLTAILAMLALAAAAGTVAVTGYQRSRREYDATVELADRERELKERPRRTIAVDGSIFKPSATSPTPTAGLSSGTAVIDGTGKLYPATVEVVKCAPLGTQFTVRLKVTVQAPGGPVDYETQDFLVQIPGAHAGFSDHATLTQ
ncbi:hypothetical protein CO046_00715 [Candidatus Peregrinibacteria bacterium CG_4_9_14_0_2_um_filter_53_11]|nr:MAG: hypothetical protein CO046_00715 [Candidatus Peregrinibacteria bacterium CG_4_9_14_0_2_um_filter_53_11]